MENMDNRGNKIIVALIVIFAILALYFYYRPAYAPLGYTVPVYNGQPSLVASPYYAAYPSNYSYSTAPNYSSSSTSRSYYSTPAYPARSSTTVYSYYNTPGYSQSYNPSYTTTAYPTSPMDCYSSYEPSGNPIVICH